MHVLYEIERLSTAGGIERIITDKANYMVDVWGWEVTILVLLEDASQPFYALSSKVKVEYLHIKSSGIAMCVRALWSINRCVRKMQPDIYVTVQTIGALSCLFRTHTIPTIYEAHGIRSCMQHQWAMTVAEKFADTVVVLTKNNAKRYSKAKRVEVIPNFTNIVTLGIPDYAQKHCIAVGRLDFEKDFSRMIALWERVHKDNSEWVLDIYGDGPERKMLQELIAKHKLGNSVVLHGATSNVSSALLSGSINLLTSRFEGFGLVLIEAANCGLPSVAFDCQDGPADIIENGKMGYLIPYNDDEAFVDRLSELINNENLRREMGMAAYNSSIHYQPARIMSMWLSLFSELAFMK